MSCRMNGAGAQIPKSTHIHARRPVDLGVHAAIGVNWVDPVIALLLAAWAVREGREAWRGEDCC